MRGMHHRFRIGTWPAVILSDGPLTLHAPQEVLLDAPPEALAAALAEAGQPTDRLRVQQNLLLLDLPGHRVLFDTGLGTARLFGEESGRLPDSLADAGIDAASITDVVLTHAHSDHAWGLSAEDGTPNFPNARIHLADIEYAHWTDPALLAAGNNSARGVQRHLVPLRDRIRLLREGKDPLPGIAALRTPGHTPGHTSYLIGAGAGALLLIGDAAFHAPGSLAFPASRSRYDTDPAQAIATRTALLARIADEGRRVIGYHYPFPGLGRIERSGAAFRFRPCTPRV